MRDTGDAHCMSSSSMEGLGAPPSWNWNPRGSGDGDDLSARERSSERRWARRGSEELAESGGEKSAVWP